MAANSEALEKGRVEVTTSGRHQWKPKVCLVTEETPPQTAEVKGGPRGGERVRTTPQRRCAGGSARTLANEREKTSRLELGMKLHYVIYALLSFPEQVC